MKLSVLYQSHRAKFLANLRSRRIQVRNSIALFKGSYRFHCYDTPTAYPLKHDQNFAYLFGLEELGYDAFIDLNNCRSYLVRHNEKVDGFLSGGDKAHISQSDYKKKLDKDHARTEISDEQAQALFGIERVLTRQEFIEFLAQAKPEKIYLNHGIDRYTQIQSNCYDDAAVLEPYLDVVDRDSIYPVLNDTRTLKTAAEAEWMRKICMISSRAHVEVMRNCRPGVKEHQIAAIFFVR